MRLLKSEKKLKGMTIVEMMVAIAIFTLMIEGFTLLFIRTWRTNSFTLETGRASMTVSQGVNKITGYIKGTRQADNGDYPIDSIDDNELIIYSDYDKDGITERLRFYKNGQSILMGVRDPSGTMPKTYASGDQETITLVNYIVNESSEPVFLYYNKDYPGDTTNNPMEAVSSNINSVRLVKVHLKIDIIPNRDPDNIEMQSFAEMRNLNDYD